MNAATTQSTFAQNDLTRRASLMAPVASLVLVLVLVLIIPATGSGYV